MPNSVRETMYYWRNAKYGPALARLVFDNADSLEVPLKQPAAFEASVPRWDEAIGVLLKGNDGKWSGQYYDAQRRFRHLPGQFDAWEEGALNVLRARHADIAEHEARLADPALALEHVLKSHDWRFAMSDDRRAFDAGNANLREISRLIRLVPVEVSRRLWAQYAPEDCKYPG